MILRMHQSKTTACPQPEWDVLNAVGALRSGCLWEEACLALRMFWKLWGTERKQLVVVLAVQAVNALAFQGLGLAGDPADVWFICLCFLCLANPARFLLLGNCRIDCGLPLRATSALGRWLLWSLPEKKIRIAVPTALVSLVWQYSTVGSVCYLLF